MSQLELFKPVSWNEAQKKRLSLFKKNKIKLAYWCSDSQGRPANHNCKVNWIAKPGLIQEVSGPLELCSSRALHATFYPHVWKGSRIWVVALHGKTTTEDPFDGSISEKLGALKREIVGEVMPEDTTNPSCRLRLGIGELRGANLYRANLIGSALVMADLYGTDLRYAQCYLANLSSSDLSESNLSFANMCQADLRFAILNETNLHAAELCGAYLVGANLKNANLTDTNLTNANLHKADLTKADLEGANLSFANLNGAVLDKANLKDANLFGANLSNAILGSTKGLNFVRKNVFGLKSKNGK